MNSSDELYKVFQKKRKILADLVQRQIKVLYSLSMTEPEESIRQLEERLLTDTFKVLVIGEFNRGKSTFINALLRINQEVLPTDILECTAIINELKWGEKPRALLHFKKAALASTHSPVDIPYNQLKEYVVIKDSSKKEQEIHETPYEKVELFWPLELCRNGVEIIDSPGLNANDVRQQITIDYLSRIDAVLFVLSCEQLGTRSEKEMIDIIRKCGHEYIFFICNRYNDIRRSEEQAKVRQSALSQFTNLTKLGKNGIFFITAVDAFEGYQSAPIDSKLIEQSGIQPLEEALATFLAKERGRVKIVRSETILRNSIEEARKIIPQRDKMLRTDFETLKARYEVAQESLRLLERDRQAIVQRISNFREDMKELVRGKSRRFYGEVAGKIDGWIRNYEIKEPLKLFSGDIFRLQSALERVVKEVTEYLSNKVESESAKWQRQDLQEFLESRLNDLMRQLDDKAGDFVVQVDKVRLQLVSGNSMSISSVEVEGTKISALERIFAAAGGYLLGDIASAGMGAIFGYKEMLKSLIPQIAVVVVTTLIAGFNPWVLIPAILGSGFINGLIKMKATNEQVKKKVSEKYITEIRSSRQPDKIADAVVAKLLEIQNTVDQGLSREIQSVRSQVESIVAEKRKGQANVDQKIQELTSIYNELNDINSELNELMRQVAQM
ncbi:MAG TPA: GTP-binding protein [Cyanobacteria bacterium UBA8543]|nr:GTP-binding protein [Cyanobacteria bacterium UBA8543]